MQQTDKKEYSKELVLKAYDEICMEEGVYSPISSITDPKDKQRLLAFHNFFSTRIKKMFAPLIEKKLGGKFSADFLDRFSFCYWDTDATNAYCLKKELPDGRICVAISRGMIELCETEGELIGIVGHEIGHSIHRLLKSYGNNEFEEQGSDIISAQHMPNAGYHPRELISIFDKIKAKNPQSSDKRELNLDMIFDPHPDDLTRDIVNKLIIQKDDHRYANLTETKLDKSDILLTDLVPMDNLLHIGNDGILFSSENKTDVAVTQQKEKFNQILDNIEALQTSLVSKWPIGHDTGKQIWRRILFDYLTGQENKREIDLQSTENATDGLCTTKVLNKVYWNKIQAFNSVLHPEELVNVVWERMAQNVDTETHQSDLCKLECSMLNRFLDVGHSELFNIESFNFQTHQFVNDSQKRQEYFQYENDRESKLPSEIVEARSYIRELLENPDKISFSIIPPEILEKTYLFLPDEKQHIRDNIALEPEEKRQKNEKLRYLIAQLGQMVDTGYLSYRNASYLLNPVFEVQEGQIHPLYKITHTPFKDVDVKGAIKSTDDPKYNPAIWLLGTLGYYDSQTFELGNPVPNLLVNDVFVPRSYNGLNHQDIKNMDEHSLFIVGAGKGLLTCEYNNKTQKIEFIQSYEIKSTHLIGDKCFKESILKNTSSFRTACDDMENILYQHDKKLYEIKTKYFNTKMHYKLKDILKSFSNSLTADQVRNVVQMSEYYLSQAASREIIQFNAETPFVLDGMDWSYSLKNRTPVDPHLVGRSEEDKNDGEHLFDFLEDKETYLNIANSYVQLLEKGITDPQIAEQVIQESLYDVEYDGTGHGTRRFHSKNPGFDILHSELFKIQIDGDFWFKYVKKHFQRRILAALNKSPYVDLMNEDVSFKSEAGIKEIRAHPYGQDRMIQDMYEVAPALVSRVFALYKKDKNGNKKYMDLPVKSASDLEKMKTLYNQNKRGNNDKDKDFQVILKVALDQYIAQRHTDVRMATVFAINKEMNSLHADTNNSNLFSMYRDNILNLRNWPIHKEYKNTKPRADEYHVRTKQAIKLIAKNANMIVDSNNNILSDIVPQSIIEHYQDMILSAPTFKERTDVLSDGVAKIRNFGMEHWQLSKAISQKIFDPSSDKTIWNRSIDENIRLYLWLNDRHAFEDNLALQIAVTKNLIDQLEESPIKEQEEYAFLLLGIRADVPSPENKQRLMQMWVQSVEQLVGSIDDMSDEYLKKVQPYISKLLNKREERVKTTNAGRKGCRNGRFEGNVSDYIYTQLSPDIRNELGKMLQEQLVSQPKLSAILQPSEYIKKGSSELLTTILGKPLKMLNSTSRPSDAEAIINFLLEPPTTKSVQTLSDMLSDDLKKYTPLEGKNLSYEWGKNFHDEFWSKTFVIRTACLIDLFNKAYPDENNQKGNQKQEGNKKTVIPCQKRLDNMMNRIVSLDIENRDQFYAALYNYATAVDKKEIYKADTLLAGCLASAPKEVNNQINLGEAVRKFLESQGAAGIKVGQFLSAHEDIPLEIREELKKLTNHATTPSRHEVFEIIRENHPELMQLIIKNGGLGKCLGAASHYLTYEMGDDQVVSISRPESATKAMAVYNRLSTAISTTLVEQPENTHLLHVIRDAVKQAQSMNEIELNGNIGYKQSILATRLYDNVEMNIDGHSFIFRAMPWKKPNSETGPYHVEIVDSSGYQYSQSFKIMEKAGGIDYDKIQDPTYKTAVAKANFLLNLRTILMGDVFDDDRHTGQLKVEQLSDNSTRINLFDTGSMSTTSPTSQELNSFGQVLHATLRAMMALQSDATTQEKYDILERVFPHTVRFNKVLTRDGNVSKSALFICFNFAVNELRNREGYTPLYISKVERSLANLSHFSNDIPANQMLPLIVNLIQNTGNIHPEIINGMGKEIINGVARDNFILDHLIMQKLLPNGQLNPNFIAKTIQSQGNHFIQLNNNDATYTRADMLPCKSTSSNTETDKKDVLFHGLKQTAGHKVNVMIQPQKNIGNVEAKNTSITLDTIKARLDALLYPADIKDKEDRKIYENALGDMLVAPAGIRLMDYLNDILKTIPNREMRDKLAERMLNVMQTVVKNLQDGKQSDQISKEIFEYLKKTGMPRRVIDRVSQHMPLRQSLKLKLGFLNAGKLTIGKNRVMQTLGKNIMKFSRAWAVIDAKKNQVLLSNSHLIIKEQQKSDDSGPLKKAIIKKSSSNDGVKCINNFYSQNSRSQRALQVSNATKSNVNMTTRTIVEEDLDPQNTNIPATEKSAVQPSKMMPIPKSSSR